MDLRVPFRLTRMSSNCIATSVGGVRFIDPPNHPERTLESRQNNRYHQYRKE